MFRLPAALLTALFAVGVPAASAATKVETRTETATRGTVFRGVGCTATRTRTLTVPDKAFSVTVLEPRQGDELISSTSDDPTATVQTVGVDGRTVTWTAVGAGEACDPGYTDGAWDTEDIKLRVRYKIRQRVLTRGTVIARADRICKAAGRKLERVERRMDRLSDTDIDGVVRALRDMAMIARGIHRRLDRLDVPSDRRKSFDGFQRALDRVQEQTDAAADSARDLNVGAMEFHVRKFNGALGNATRHAKRYGFHYCFRGD